jgi:Tfp pilus assembly protein PilO
MSIDQSRQLAANLRTMDQEIAELEKQKKAYEKQLPALEAIGQVIMGLQATQVAALRVNPEQLELMGRVVKATLGLSH